MTLRFCDSFDHYVTANILAKWTNRSSTTPTIEAGQGRGSTACLRLGNANRFISKTLVAKATLATGGAYRVAALPGAGEQFFICGFYDGSSLQVDARLNNDGTISVTRNGTELGKTAYALVLGNYYYVEFRAVISNTVGQVEVRVDCGSKLSLTGVDTQATANAYANVIKLGGSDDDVTVNIDYDDVYICDGDGTVNNSFVGDVTVTVLVPDADSPYKSQWIPSPLDGHYAQVDEAAPDDDSTFVSAVVSGDTDLYGFEDLYLPSGSIKAVVAQIYARKDDAGERFISPVVRSGEWEFVQDEIALGQQYEYHAKVYEENPVNSGEWLVEDLNVTEFGVAVGSGG